MILRTPRLVLRRAQPADLHDLHDAFSRPEAMRYWATPEHETLDETWNFLSRMIEGTDADDFVIEHEGRAIGKAGAWRLPEVGFLLHPDHWGKGLALEAMTAVIDHLFAAHPLTGLSAEADPRNDASVGLLTRLGFHETHRAERTMQWRDEWCDSIYFALPRQDWIARSA
jgi:[ribosomal protein S5]-alanine N-acetyltransferase